MAGQHFILIETLCVQYQIERKFMDELHEIGLIQIETIEHEKFIHQDSIGDLEKMIRLHHELNVNLEGIDVVFNLLQNEMRLREEIHALKNRLRIYEKGD